jgi:hypothetical protein
MDLAIFRYFHPPVCHKFKSRGYELPRISYQTTKNYYHQSGKRP